MKGRLRDGPTTVLGALERDRDVVAPAGHRALPFHDDAATRIAGRYADRAFMRMRGQVLDHTRGRAPVAHHRVNAADRSDALVVAVRARVVVGPRDGSRERVVDALAIRIGLAVAAVEVMRGADAAQVAYRTAQVHVVARDHEAAAATAESADACAIFRCQAVAGVDGKEPELVEVRFIQRRQHGVGSRARRAVAGGHPEGGPTVVVLQLREKRTQATEARNVPVVRVSFDGGLQQ